MNATLTRPSFLCRIGAAMLLGAWAAPAAADIIEVIGASLRVNNPDSPAAVTVQAKFLGDAGSLYDNELFLDAPTFQGPIFNNHLTPVGATASLGSFQPETALFIRNQAYFIPNPGGPASYNFGFFTGDGTLPLNPDRLPHAILSFDTEDPDGGVTVRFEDQFGGGDLDFNDAVYSFTNVRIGFVDVALAPISIPVGETVTVDQDETRFWAPFQDTLGNSGTITNNGSITNYGSADNSGLFSNLANFFNDLPAEIRNTSGAQLDNQGLLSNFGTFINEGDASNSGTVANAGVVQNVGTITNAAAGTVRNQVTGALNNLGTWINEDSSTTENQGQVVNSGTVQNVGTMINIGVGTVSNEIGGVIDNVGTWLNKDQGAVQNEGAISNSGTIQNIGTMVTQGTGTISNSVSGAIDNLGAWLNGTGTETHNDGTITNSGSFTIEQGASVTGTGTFSQSGDAVTTVNGALNAATINVESGIVTGAGLLRGFLNAGADATVSPGNSPGTLTVDGNFELDGGTLAIELASVALHDVLDISGTAAFSGGTVDYRFLGAVNAGDSFAWLVADGGITGFETLAFNFTGAPPDLTFLTELDGNSIVLRAAPVPLPTSLGLLVTGLATAGLRSRRRRA